MKKKHSIITSNRAVSEVVSALLALMIVLGAVATIMIWGLPYIEERKMKNQSQNALSSFNLMYSTLSEMIIDGTSGAKGNSNIMNTNDQGSVKISSSEDNLIIMYSYKNDYSFNISNLDDDDNSFKWMGPDVPLIDKITIYWLNPGEIKQVSTPQKLEIIYQDNWCAQKFQAPNTIGVWNLEKVRIKIGKNGNPSSPLNLSIYNDLSGNPLTSFDIAPDDISADPDWIDCVLSDIQTLANGGDYYLVLNTSGGSLEEGYYLWYLDKCSPYDDSYPLASTDGGDNWGPKDSDYDFPCRFMYQGIVPPTVQIDIDTYVYSGVSVAYSVSASGSTTPKVRVLWGDDTNTDWKGTPYTSTHTWGKPGTYTVTAQARDENGIVNQPDQPESIKTVTVTEGDYLPDDIDRAQTEEDSAGVFTAEGDFTAENPLKGTLRIDLFSSTYKDTPIAKIWKFNLGSITYSSPYSTGTQNTVFQNGAIISTGPLKNIFNNPPSFFEQNDVSKGLALAFRIIQLNGSSSAGGRGTYKLEFTMKNSFSREPGYPKVSNLKIQINNSDKNLQKMWMDYFTTTYNFERLTGSEPWEQITLKYKSNDVRFVLDNSIIETKVVGVT